MLSLLQNGKTQLTSVRADEGSFLHRESLSQLSVFRVVWEHVLALSCVTIVRLGLALPEFPFLPDSGQSGPQGTLGGGRGDVPSLPYSWKEVYALGRTGACPCCYWPSLVPTLLEESRAESGASAGTSSLLQLP